MRLDKANIVLNFVILLDYHSGSITVTSLVKPQNIDVYSTKKLSQFGVNPSYEQYYGEPSSFVPQSQSRPTYQPMS